MSDKRVDAGLEPGTKIGNLEGSGPAATPAKHVQGKGRGQQVSQERGVATNHKKNPGKRPKQGG